MSGISKPMVCQTYGLHAGRLSRNEGNQENIKNNEDNSDSCKQGVECWISGNHGTTEMMRTTGIRGANHRFPNNGFRNIRNTSFNGQTLPGIVEVSLIVFPIQATRIVSEQLSRADSYHL